MKNVEEFVDKLVEDKGFNEQDPEVIEQIKNDLIDRVENRVNAMILSELKPEKITDFEKALDSGNDEEIQKFIKENIEDIDEKIARELLAFKSIYLG